ncbi:hypothetical protein MTsPCn5_03840 [Croceitalea sp. MTPC5]|uniref:hypothetical protein n=1 Tax=Croceitalea sp. MTPC5 TaxID=3056565 RepID=UPI002B385A4D|nr:hypothetical protein MTsPCn5_03840 [Croceitalea sp. MTPC5]
MNYKREAITDYAVCSKKILTFLKKCMVMVLEAKTVAFSATVFKIILVNRFLRNVANGVERLLITE